MGYRRTQSHFRGLGLMLLLLLTKANGAAALSDASKCEASKNKAAGKYAACRLKAEASAIKSGGVADYSKCDAKLDLKWTLVEAGAGGACPTTGDVQSIRDFVAGHTDNVAFGLAVGSVSACNPTATSARPLRTGQTQCDQGNATMGACPGSPVGQDGAAPFGVSRSYTDHGDGTITDNRTGLTWEKLSDDGSVHDRDDTFDWYAAFTKIAALNTAAFAGHADWRLPNLFELHSLSDFGRAGPALDPILDNNCLPGCAVTACACTPPVSIFWTSTSHPQAPYNAYHVNHYDGATYENSKLFNNLAVRAVRGGFAERAPLGQRAGDICAAAKNRLAGKYAQCRQKAEAKAIKSGATVDFSRCDDTLSAKWPLAETKASGACPTSGDESAIAALVADHSDSIHDALAGSGPSTCGFSLSRPLVTGQTQCDDGSGVIGACPGSPNGQDGALAKGVSRDYTDNGDETITDNRTGLTWEKLSYDGSIHDWGDDYDWYSASTKITTLNTSTFAGHADWRLPNIVELYSLANTGQTSFDEIDPVFNANCEFGCDSVSCSCPPFFSWSSTSYQSLPQFAFGVLIFDATVQYHSKTTSYGVRAVRGGL
jgi:Protein of unknown function (DUF1566)